MKEQSGLKKQERNKTSERFLPITQSSLDSTTGYLIVKKVVEGNCEGKKKT